MAAKTSRKPKRAKKRAAGRKAAIVAEAKFRGLVETAPDAILSVDREGRMVFVNSQTEKMFGYSRDELLGEPVEMLVPERFRDRHVGHRTDYTSNPRTRLMGVWFDIRGRRKDGSDIPVDIALSPVETDGGLLVTTIIRDISEQKQAEKALQARYEELYALHEIGQIVLNSLDLKTTVEGILDKAMALGPFDIGMIRLLDLSNRVLKPVALRGYQDPNNVREITAELENSRAGPVLTEVLSSKEAHVVENVPLGRGLRAFKKEGVQSAIVVPVRAQEQVLGTIQLGSRTPRKFEPHKVRLLETLGSQLGTAAQKNRLYQEAQRNWERIHALHEMDLVITSTLDLRSILDLFLEKLSLLLPYRSVATIRLRNRETGKLEPVACRNLNEEEWKAHESEPGHGAGHAKMALEPQGLVVSRNVQTDPNTRHPGFVRRHGLISYLGVPLIAKEETLGILGLYTKAEHEFGSQEIEFISTLAGQAAVAIHNSQLYEEMVKLAGDLSRSNRVKDEFLSVMSHELRTPLNVVMGYTSMIKDRMLGEVNAEQERALEKVISHARDQLTMINSILVTTQMEAHEVKADIGEVHLSGLLDNLRSSYQIPLGKEIEVRWDYPPDLPVIKTDSTKLKQILQNLIDNAVKFTDKGSVTVSAKLVQATGERQQATERHEATGIRQQEEHVTSASSLTPQALQSWVEFKVADTGIGIPKEALPFIFEKFRQLDSSETRLYGGVGLGLYIVKKLTELLGGKIEVESEPGKGTTFTIRMPIE